jgi:hypothetical protein
MFLYSEHFIAALYSIGIDVDLDPVDPKLIGLLDPDLDPSF